MNLFYLRRADGIVQLVRFLGQIIVLSLTETCWSDCSSSLNEFLGFNRPSILFFYILIWISFSFEIYFLFNRIFGSEQIQSRFCLVVLDSFLSVSFLLAGSLTFYAFVQRSNGHQITQHDEKSSLPESIPVTELCNNLRWIGIVFAFFFAVLYLTSIIFIVRTKR